jgi:hypothetical protein
VSVRVLYLVTSHTNPEQVARLVRTLRAGSTLGRIAVHHDASKSRLDPTLFDGMRDVHLLPFTVPVTWGDFSIVDMNLRAFRWSLEHIDFDWMVLLSGQDYPIRPLAELEEILGTSEVDGFLEQPVPVEDRPPHHGRGRIEYDSFFRYHYRYREVPLAGSGRAIPRWVRRALARAGGWLRPRVQRGVFVHPMPSGAPRVGVRRIRTPFGPTFRCFKSSQWFTLSRRSIELLAEFADAHPDVVAFYRGTVIPDESLFQSILLNHPGWRFHPDNMVFYRWSRQGAGSPDVLTMADLEEVVASRKRFARKVDHRVDPDLLDALDGRLHLPPRD